MQSPSGGDRPQASNDDVHPARCADRGDVHFRSKDFDRAIADYSEAIRLIETDRRFALLFLLLATTYHSRSIAYRQKGDLNGAQADLLQAKRIGYDDASMRFNEQRLGVEGYLGVTEVEEPMAPFKRIDINEALEVMRPYLRMGVMLERIWPPGDASTVSLSQIGGFPNWPADWPWPSITFEDGREASLDFLAQVNLGELPNVEQRELLPKDGMLYFFALAESHEPLDSLGRDAWRVLYYPGDASAFPRRPPPVNVGWNLDEMDHIRPPTAEFRDPDRNELIPRCPVRPIAAPTWEPSEREDADQLWRAVWDNWSGSAPPPTTFKYDEALLPSHVEDALLLLNFARNAWFEGAADFARVVENSYGRSGDLDVQALRTAYGAWHGRVMSFVAHLRSKGRATLLTEGDRSTVRALVAECSALREPLTGGKLVLYPKAVCMTSLATLLLDHPEAANDRADEIAAAHPAYTCRTGSETHRMLGYSCSVQEDIPEGSVLLLQLGSDVYGPRFMWWDMSNITFWISSEDLASLRFDRATAEIQGY
jgi:uncharacterized protein YwqG